jgi:hypothetical protein
MHCIRQAESSLYDIPDNGTHYFGNTAGWDLLKLHSGVESTETANVF